MGAPLDGTAGAVLIPLLACPFCGGDAELRGAGSSGTQHWAECLVADCHAMGPNRGSPRDAATGWNRRQGVTQAPPAPAAVPPEMALADEDDAL